MMGRSPWTNCLECPLQPRQGQKFLGGRGHTEVIYEEVPYRGPAEAEVMIVGESPGVMEVAQGSPFVGPSGDLSNAVLREAGIDPGSVFYANACRCMIPKKELTEKEIAKAMQCCRGALIKSIEVLKPKLIICYGDIALRQVLKQRGITSKRGRFQFSKEFNCWVLPTFHPAYCLRDQRNLGFFRPDLMQAARFIRGELTPSSGDTATVEEGETIREILDMQGVAVSLDTETQGLDWTNPSSVVIGYSVSARDDYGIYIPLLRQAEPDERESFRITWTTREGLREIRVLRLPDYDRKIEELRELCKRPDLIKVMMNGNYDLHRLRQLGIEEVHSYRMDIQVAFHCLDPDLHKGSSLADIQRVLLPETEDYKEVFGSTFDKNNMLSVASEDPKALAQYAARDAVVTLRCAKRIGRELAAFPELRNYYVKLAHPVTAKVLYSIEKNGIQFDLDGLADAKRALAVEIAQVQREFLSLVPRAVRDLHESKGKKGESGCVLTRAEFIRDVFFSRYGFNLKPLSTTASGKISTDKKMFAELSQKLDPDSDASRAVSLLLEWSPLYKLYSTYIKGFEEAVKSDGRLHTQITKVMTATGRTSSRSPNLQNIPKRNKRIASVIRRLLTAPEGKMLVAADYSQQELRWIAHRSRDPEFIRVYRSGEDIHARTAMALLRITSPDQVSPDVFSEARRNAKSCNFGFVYGMQAKKFRIYARDEYKLSLTEEEAEKWRNNFFTLYRGLPAWHQREIEFARKNGYCLSPFGFCRRLPNIKSQDPEVRSQEERYAINTPIQNAGSDSTLLAALWAIRTGLVDDRRAKIVLFIHDELIFEVEEDFVPIFANRLKETMEGMGEVFRKDFGFEMAVPLEADVEIGKNLAEMQSYEGDSNGEDQESALSHVG